MPRFAQFEVDFASGELRKAGLRLKLPGVPVRVLELLLENPGAVVTREELRARLWPAGTFVDFENSLNTAMNKLRAALGDTAAHPRYIETLPRRGYRFIAPVTGASKAVPRIAVLPFENLGQASEPEQEYFADGLTEELIARLGRLHASRLSVIARSSAMFYKRSHKTATAIALELNVDYVLEGTVRHAGERVRISAELIRATDQVQLWAETYDRTLEDILDLQADVAQRIGQSLALELLPQTGPAQAVAPAAYEAYLKGRFHWNQRTEAGFAKAVEYYRLSISLDSTFALAYVGLADIYNVIGLYGVVGFARFAPPDQSREEAQTAIQKALAIDQHLGEAHTALAFSKFLYDWDWDGAEREFQWALRLNPNDAAGHGWYALFLVAMGRTEDALAAIGAALALDPLSLVANAHKGWILYFARQYDRAIAQLQLTREMDAAFPMARYILGLAYIQKRTYREAFASVGHPGIFSALRERYLQALGGQAVPHSENEPLPEYLQALVHMFLGEKDAALDCLERAYEKRSCWLVNLRVEPAVDSLRGEARFQRLLGQVGL